MADTVSRRPLWLGLALCATAVAMVGAGAGWGGPLNPSAPGPLTGRVLQWLALPVAVLGGTLVAIWMGRRAAEEDAAAGSERP